MFLSRAAWPIAADRSSLAMPGRRIEPGSLGGAVADFAGRLDDGDIGGTQARRGILHIVGELDRFRAAAGTGIGGGARLIVIADAVHQPAGARVFGELRAGFQACDHFWAGDMAVGRHLADGAVIDRVHQRGELLAVGGRHLLFHEHVGGAFIFGALGDLRLGIDLVQGAAQEQLAAARA